jgi:hypothetical protein
MAAVEEKFDGKLSFWEARSHSRNDRLYTEKRPIESGQSWPISQGRTVNKTSLKVTANEEASTTVALGAVQKEEQATKVAVEMGSMHVPAEASTAGGSGADKETELRKGDEEDGRMDQRRKEILSSAPLPPFQDERRKSRLGVRTQTLFVGLKRRMSILGKDKL